MSVALESDIEPLAGEWDELADRSHAAPFLRPGWFSAWWRAFGAGELAVLTLRRRGRLEAILPLARRHGGLESLTNYHTPAFAPVAADHACSNELAEAVLREVRPRRLSLAMVDQDAGFAYYALSVARPGYRVLTREQGRIALVDLRRWPESFAELPTKFRKELRRYRRRLEERGPVEFEVFSGGNGFEPKLEEAFKLENTGWKRAAGTAMASRPETRRFYTEVARWAAARGALRLVFLRVGGRSVAVDFCLEDHGVRHMLKGGFDPALAHCSPGILLLESGLAHAAETGVVRVDLGAGENAYKLRWGAILRERRLVQAFARSPFGLADWAAQAVARPAAKRVVNAANRARAIRPGRATRMRQSPA